MRFVLVMLLAAVSSAAAAEAVDCNAIKNTSAPVELRYHGALGDAKIVQVYRDKPGEIVAWTSFDDGKIVLSATLIDGVVNSSETTTVYAGKYKASKRNYQVEGLPKNFDHKSDLTYTISLTATYVDGSTEVRTNSVAYKYKSESQETIGPCVLTAIHGQTDLTDANGKVRRSQALYFPDLGISLSEPDSEAIVEGLSTVFTPLKHLR